MTRDYWSHMTTQESKRLIDIATDFLKFRSHLLEMTEQIRGKHWLHTQNDPIILTEGRRPHAFLLRNGYSQSLKLVGL